MKKGYRHDRNRLILDAIYECDDPEINEFMNTTLLEEISKAYERTILRMANKYKQLLSPRMQKILAERNEMFSAMSQENKEFFEKVIMEPTVSAAIC